MYYTYSERAVWAARAARVLPAAEGARPNEGPAIGALEGARRPTDGPGPTGPPARSPRCGPAAARQARQRRGHRRQGPGQRCGRWPSSRCGLGEARDWRATPSRGQGRVRGITRYDFYPRVSVIVYYLLRYFTKDNTQQCSSPAAPAPAALLQRRAAARQRRRRELRAGRCVPRAGRRAAAAPARLRRWAGGGGGQLLWGSAASGCAYALSPPPFPLLLALRPLDGLSAGDIR